MAQYSQLLQYNSMDADPAIYTLLDARDTQYAPQYLTYFDKNDMNQFAFLDDEYDKAQPRLQGDSIISTMSVSPSTSTSSKRRLSKDSEECIILPALERRRLQNRKSQRLFRERRNKELETLQDQIPRLETKHEQLLESHSNQIVELNKLRAQVEELTNRIKALTREMNTIQANGLTQSWASACVICGRKDL